jgi:hypothetical protein
VTEIDKMFTEIMGTVPEEGASFLGNTYASNEDYALGVLKRYQILPDWVNSKDDYYKFLAYLNT